MAWGDCARIAHFNDSAASYIKAKHCASWTCEANSPIKQKCKTSPRPTRVLLGRTSEFLRSNGDALWIWFLQHFEASQNFCLTKMALKGNFIQNLVTLLQKELFHFHEFCRLYVYVVDVDVKFLEVKWTNTVAGLLLFAPQSTRQGLNTLTQQSQSMKKVVPKYPMGKQSSQIPLFCCFGSRRRTIWDARHAWTEQLTSLVTGNVTCNAEPAITVNVIFIALNVACKMTKLRQLTSHIWLPSSHILKQFSSCCTERGSVASVCTDSYCSKW